MGILSFFGCNSKTNKNEKVKEDSVQIITYSSLSNNVKDKLKNELEYDDKIEFNKEWVRTTDLQTDIINKYGFEGIKLIFEYRNSHNYYNIGSFPKDCPWNSLNDLSIQECIEKNFDPLKNKLPLLIKALKERCKFIYVEKKENTWHLHYFLEMKLHDNRSYHKVYTGGVPLLDPEPNKNLKAYNWNVPSDLELFYSIHNGFGEIYDAYFIMSNEDIKVMAEMMDPICKEQNVTPEGYSFADLLEFYPDGGGNAQCFLRVNGNTSSTVDWDHEVWEIQWEMGFFEFINERMSEIDEE
tara:strand:+ start:1910 stop:2800 length:891 start_codon:yes stop_codon:yes gene_type:complete